MSVNSIEEYADNENKRKLLRIKKDKPEDLSEDFSITCEENFGVNLPGRNNVKYNIYFFLK